MASYLCIQRNAHLIEEDGYMVVEIGKHYGLEIEAAGVWFGQNHLLNCIRYGKKKGPAEIEACTEAVLRAFTNGCTKLKIKTDSRYIYYSMTRSIYKWQTNGWKTNRGTNVRDEKYFIVLIHSCDLLRDVKWELVEICEDAKMLARETLEASLALMDTDCDETF